MRRPVVRLFFRRIVIHPDWCASGFISCLYQQAGRSKAHPTEFPVLRSGGLTTGPAKRFQYLFSDNLFEGPLATFPSAGLGVPPSFLRERRSISLSDGTPAK